MNESQVILSPSIAPIFFIFLEENLKYSYKIIATNNYSISSETEKYDFCELLLLSWQNIVLNLFFKDKRVVIQQRRWL